MAEQHRYTSNDIMNLTIVIGLLSIAVGIICIFAFKNTISETLANILVALTSGLIGFLSRGSDRTRTKKDIVDKDA